MMKMSIFVYVDDEDPMDFQPKFIETRDTFYSTYKNCLNFKQINFKSCSGRDVGWVNSFIY